MAIERSQIRIPANILLRNNHGQVVYIPPLRTTQYKRILIFKLKILYPVFYTQRCYLLSIQYGFVDS